MAIISLHFPGGSGKAPENTGVTPARPSLQVCGACTANHTSSCADAIVEITGRVVQVLKGNDVVLNLDDAEHLAILEDFLKKNGLELPRSNAPLMKRLRQIAQAAAAPR